MTSVSAPDRVRQLVKLIAAEVRCRFGAETRVIWFGSWVDGSAPPNADIDLGVLTPHPVTHSEWTDPWSWVDDVNTLYSIDLVDLQTVGEHLRKEALIHGADV